ncbi:pyridoxal phosphate-dependent decarboxylase family protein [Chitinophaga pinensis]|uniref:Pyridoxal-dependent decarboxylase n=1 Tax=Chitinophaga pinensis (strain ATCC 43595 / DSM 2588 / LMG 13176 / NBRC 15968 / NCIMB 11800 / UQM 2034) TaxID=485918 RepID=A0A979G3X5_CHIPD|nr:pyridoxal-dependent decarboxylase [Chitinophaga pinensis]ACU60404.1 Pyridoxal-dependent decarboxylase [Chitinophaga pinensis DSM 2588]
MNQLLNQDLQQLDNFLQEIKDYSVLFLSSVETLPVKAATASFENFDLPRKGMGAMHTLSQFRKRYEEHLAGNSGPRNWGFVTGGATIPAIAGDWLTSVFDMNASDRDIPPFKIETETISMLRQLFGLPDAFSGNFVTGATMANFSGLAIARQWLGKQLGVDVAQEGMAALANAKIVSCTPHSSSVKSMAMLGFGRNALVKIPALPDREAFDIEALKEYLLAHKGEPLIVLASAGTVNTVDFDDLQAIVALKKEYNFWLHVDAAFGAFAACVPEYKQLLDGWEEADSITIDAHKWLNVPYDAAMVFTRHLQLQLDTFKNVGAAYLGDPEKDFKYSNYTPENSRRLRALPAWFTLVAYGAEGYTAIVNNNIQLARQLGTLISESDAFHLLAPVRLCVVCFTLHVADEEKQAGIDAFLKALNDSGKVMMTPTVYQGVPAIRAAFVNWRTTEKDLTIAWEDMLQQAAGPTVEED